MESWKDYELPKKYEDSKVKGIRKTVLRKLEAIAMEESYTLQERGGIEGRSNDTEDFPEISIFSLQRMLERAYLLGKSEATKGGV